MARVLIVDDSAVDRRVVQGIVERGGDYDVSVASDGREALQQIERQIPDVIVTDLLMPGIDGFGLVAAVKEEYPTIPVILMTGRGGDEVAAKALQHGAASFVRKASLSDDLVPEIRRVLSTADADRLNPRLLHHMGRCALEFTLVNDLNLLRAAAGLFQQLLRCLPLADEVERLRVGIAVEEALTNALYHGNLQIGEMTPKPPRLEYARIARERACSEPYCDRRIHVQATIDRTRAVFVIRDEGPGFDPASLPDVRAVSEEENPRGIALMNTIVDSVEFNDAGNQVTLTKLAISHEPASELDETGAFPTL